MFDFHFDIRSTDPDTDVTVSPIAAEDGIAQYRILVRLPKKAAPSPVRIEWEDEMRDILGVWRPSCGTDHAVRQWFSPTVSRSCFHFGAPVLAVFGDLRKNRGTVAVADPVTPLEVRFWVKDLEQQNRVGFALCLFTEATDPFETYETTLRIDCRPVPYSLAVEDVYPWWKACGWSIPDPPRAAEDPLYSSWYNFHQAPNGEKLLEELKIASELGFRTVILDDGWQFPGPSCGDYSLCGEWQVAGDKFPDFRAFADAVHGYGMKLMVWFTVPFIGVKSPLFEAFRGKYLYIDRGLLQAGTLDIRYPEIRRIILANYRRFLTEYDIDGFKFDFIDSFYPGAEAAPYDPAVMDCPTVGEAVRKLLEEITEELGAIKPDLLYEYRQNYVGPAVNRFGNMLRVGDCAYDANVNRIGTVDLRLLHYPVAVHSDMLFWASSESLILCAKQLLGVMFSVPQISVLLTESTEEQKELIRAFLAYWVANREILLHGAFMPERPEANYPVIVAEGADKQIAVLYGERSFRVGEKPCDVFADCGEDPLILENMTDQRKTVEIYDRFGSFFLGTEELAPHDLRTIALPRAGMARIL
ncbi:MAG: alpha-galactosidase [Clostridiales bacterium]|nr:alpha-galactosidase [Clostridiales bacterium]